MSKRSIAMPLGIVVRKQPGVTRWAKWVWRAVAVLPGAGPANWTELRREGEAVEYHAGTVELVLYRTDTEAYLQGLTAEIPSIYVVMHQSDGTFPVTLHSATASPYEAQDHEDSGEELVNKVPMPAGLIAWVREFIEQHHEEEVFVKRRRDRVDTEMVQDGIGDNRITQTADVYRSPTAQKKRKLQ